MNISKEYLKEILDCVEWIRLVQDRSKWQALVNMAKNTANFLTRFEPRTLLRLSELERMPTGRS